MKIFIIGSMQFRESIEAHRDRLISEGHDARMPDFGNGNRSALTICENNRAHIEWADMIYLVWNKFSLGTILDFGVAFGLRKPLKAYHIYQPSEPAQGFSYDEIAEIMRLYGRKFDETA